MVKIEGNKHHQVPKMLLKRWTNEKGEVLYKRRGWRRDEWKARGPKGVMFEYGFYALPGMDDPEVAEKMLGVLENSAEKIIENILNEARSKAADAQIQFAGKWEEGEEEILKDFVLCQRMRTRPTRDELLSSHSEKDFISRIKERMKANPDIARYAEEMDEEGLCRMHKHMVIQTQVSPKHRWGLLSGFETCEIVIGRIDLDAPKLALTDQPVLMAGSPRTVEDDTVGSRRGIPGQNPGKQLIMAIDPRYALVLMMPNGTRGQRKVRRITRTNARDWLGAVANEYEQVIAPWGDKESQAFFRNQQHSSRERDD